MIAVPVPDGTLAGYRLVRKLAVGSRAMIYLGVGAAGSVVLKVYAPDTSRASVETELDALGRLESPHLVRLLDISSSSGDLPIVILERVANGSVAALIGDRGERECGEAVTLLAPIAALVGQLHDAGVAHGQIGPSSVHLGLEGRPVLLGLGHCTLFAAGGTMAAIDSEPAAAIDRDALAALCLTVLGRVRDAAGNHHARDLAAWIETAPRAYEFPRELEERLFACAEPLPVSFSTERVAASALPGRLMPVGDQSSRPQLNVEAQFPVKAELPAVQDHALPGWLPTLLLENPVEVVKNRVRAFIRGVRPRFWVLGGAVAVALMLAAATLPSGAAASPHSATPDRAHPTRTPTRTVLPEDPVLAAKVLLASRTTCIRDLSILCLDGVDEVSSGAFASDAALIQKVQDGGEVPTTNEGATLTLVERLGDTALIRVGGPGAVSILVIKTTAGWRIRDILNGAQATGAPPA